MVFDMGRWGNARAAPEKINQIQGKKGCGSPGEGRLSR